jgi:pimeloyl-ACP methyl ester carboxylesterase
MVVVADGRHVHYRVAGKGKPVVLLHQSPLSSLDFVDLIEELAEDYLVIAPDTPGNGLSDPLTLPDETSAMADYADALVLFLDAIGLDKVALYGFHTGALCALEFALRHPDRLTVAVANGYIDLPADLRADLLAHYFAPVEPDWAGGHLHWWWMRLREQFHFFPWYRRVLACRTTYDMPRARELHVTMMEVMRAGNAYRRPYMAAMGHDSLAALQKTTAAVTVMVDKTDLLYPCLDAIVDPAPGVEIGRPEDPRAAIAMLKNVLARQEGVPAILRKSVHEPAGGVRRELVQCACGTLHVRTTEGAGVPVLLVPDALEGCARWEAAMRVVAGRRPIVAIDPPGAGASSAWNGEGDALTVQAEAVCAELERRGIGEIEVIARERGAPLALSVAHRFAGRCHLVLPEIMSPEHPADIDRLTPDTTLDELGNHITRVWAMLRAQELYCPWYLQDAAHVIRSREPDIEPSALHLRLVDFFDALPRHREIIASNAEYPVQSMMRDWGGSINRLRSVDDYKTIIANSLA